MISKLIKLKRLFGSKLEFDTTSVSTKKYCLEGHGEDYSTFLTHWCELNIISHKILYMYFCLVSFLTNMETACMGG